MQEVVRVRVRLVVRVSAVLLVGLLVAQEVVRVRVRLVVRVSAV